MDASRVFKLSGDHVVLDFVNTLDDRFVLDAQVEKLESYADLLRFSEQAGILSSGQAASLARLAKQGKAAAVVRRSVELRELFARVFYSVVTGRRVAGDDLQLLNQSLSETMQHRVLTERGGEFFWQWQGLDKELEAPLWPLLQAAAELLAAPELKSVRECGRDTCRWLFLDTSKNHSRRWCDMKVCGNRVKAQRYYALHGRE